MADSTTNLDIIIAGANAATRVNETLDAASPATLYGRRASTTTGLTWGYYGGSFAGTTLANGTVALTANATNYIVALRTTGAVSVSTSSTNFNNVSTYLPLYQVVAGASTVTSYVDRRQVLGVVPVVDKARAYLTADQVIPAGGLYKILLDAVSYDTNSIFNASNSRFTPKKSGYYQVNAQVSARAADGSPFDAFLVIAMNGGVTSRGIRITSPNINASHGGDLLFFNGTTDYLELQYFTQSAVTTESGTSSIFMSVAGPF